MQRFISPPQSSWAWLRAAQFAIADQIRNQKDGWLGRPVALTVCMQGVAGSKPSWVWQPETDLALFQGAATRLANEVFVSQTGKPQDDQNLFADGWPHVNWSNPPVLNLPGTHAQA